MELRRRILFILFLFSPFVCSVTPSYANGNILKIEHQSDNYWFIQGGGGVSMQVKPSDSYIRVAPENPEPYQQDLYRPQKTDNGVLGTLGFGYANRTDLMWFSTFALSANYTFGYNNKTKGIIYEFGLPKFGDYDYSYDITRNTFMFDLRTDIARVINKIYLYILAGAGCSINRASNYQEQAKPFIILPKESLNFANHNETNFAWEAGVGLDFDISKNWSMLLGYLYTDAGKIGLGNSTQIAGLSGPRQKLRLSNLLLSISYKF